MRVRGFYVVLTKARHGCWLLQPGQNLRIRAEGDAEVMVCAVVEIDRITQFETQTQRAESWLDSACQIEREIQIRGAESDKGVGQRREREQAWTQPKIHESGLGGQEGMESALARGLELGAEPAVGYANGSALNCGNIAGANVAECLIEVDAVIVGKFALQHDSGMDSIAEARAQAEVVGFGLGNAEVVEKNTGLNTFLRVQRRAGCAEEKGHCYGSERARGEQHPGYK